MGVSCYTWNGHYQRSIIFGIDIEPVRVRQEIHLEFGLEYKKGCITPLYGRMYLTSQSEQFEDPYREAIGDFMYLMVGTRPDIDFTVSFLAKDLENPADVH